MNAPLRVGLETETFLLNEKGEIANAADTILEQLHKKNKENQKYIVQECAKCMVEVKAPPHSYAFKTARQLLENMEAVQEIAQKQHLSLLALGVYPGTNTPEIRDETRYHVQSELLGKNRFLVAGRCTGFHCHYELPFTLPLVKNISLLQFLDLPHENALVNGFNMMVALDPALTTFMQSSPFYQGKNLAKDTRMLLYRGSPALKCSQALYHNYPEFGELPGYKHSLFEVTEMIEEKFYGWKKYLLEIGVNIKTLSLHGSLLNTAWNPVKINQLGTLEQRGMDMNSPKYFIAAATLLKFALNRIYDEELQITPTEIGIKEPFKVEGRTVHVPPQEYVQNVLQVASAYNGISSPKVQQYCRSVLQFAKKTIDQKRMRLLVPFDKIVEEKKTVSDDIIRHARKLGWEQGTLLQQRTAAHLALKYAEQLPKEIASAKKQLLKIESCF